MEFKLFFFLIGCRLPNRYTEQHDVFFGIGKTPADMIPALNNFWSEAESLHIDCWREVSTVNGYKIKVVPKDDLSHPDNQLSLYFINLGGYRKGEFEEFHFKDIFVAKDMADAIKWAKKTPFYLHYGFKGAVAHVDNKYGVDVDEIFQVEEILPLADKIRYSIVVTNELADEPDEINLGYTTLSKLKQY